MNRKIYKQLLSAVTLYSILLTGPAVFGQAKRGSRSGVTAVKSEKKPVCQGGWSGYISYTKTLQDSLSSDEPGIRKAMDRIIHKTSRDYQYIGRAIIDGTDPKNPSVTTNVNFGDKDNSWGMEKVFDSCNSTEAGHWFIIEGNDRRLTEGRIKGPARSFNLSVDELTGTYGFSLQFPNVPGTFNREEHVKKTGHCQAKNNEPYDRITNQQTPIDGQSVSVHQEKIDLNDPDTLTGSKTWSTGTDNVKGFTYHVNWRFKRCPQKLMITEYKLEHPKFPRFDDWQEIARETGTIDGNRVKIKAKVANLSGEDKYAVLSFAETFKGDQWNGARPDEPLPDAEIGVRLEAGEEREFELTWDTDGQSWFDDGRPHLLHRLKAEVKEEGRVQDQRMEPLKVSPKPLILAHDMWGTSAAWSSWQNYLTLNHNYGWKAYAVGERSEHGRMRTGGRLLSGDKFDTIAQNARQLAQYVKYAQEESNAWHVDLVGHGLGGLISRFYINSIMPKSPDNAPVAKHLVMLGTANNGSPCALLMEWGGAIFAPNDLALKELTPDYLRMFNSVTVDRKGVKFSALAGNPMPFICRDLTPNDGFVSVESATYSIDETGISNDIHKHLIQGRNFSNFVLPHVVTGPQHKYPLPVKNDPTGIDKYKMNGSLLTQPTGDLYRGLFVNASYADQAPPLFTKDVRIGPLSSVEIEVPVSAGPNLGITFMADEAVSATLVDNRGTVVSRNEAGSDLASGYFRSLFYSKPVAAGVWRIRLQNTSQVEQPALATAWSLGTAPPRLVAE